MTLSFHFVEPGEVERFGVMTKSGRPSAARRQLPLVIREPLGDFELQLAVLLHVVEETRAGVHERLDKLAIHHLHASNCASR